MVRGVKGADRGLRGPGKKPESSFLISFKLPMETGARVASDPSYRWQSRDFVSGLADAH